MFQDTKNGTDVQICGDVISCADGAAVENDGTDTACADTWDGSRGGGACGSVFSAGTGPATKHPLGSKHRKQIEKYESVLEKKRWKSL